MRTTFVGLIDRLPEKADAILHFSPFKIGSGLPKDIPASGLYLFSKGDKHLYVGRSDNIKQRMSLHTRPSATQNQATFAFRIAKKRLRIGKPSYTTRGSRHALASERRFARAFSDAKKFVRSLEVRFLEEKDLVMQALLEIYLSVELRTPYNKFETT